MIVFAVKAALFPVQFWLPGTYANAPAPVAALFAIMTKVGAYAILRVHTVVFGPDTPPIGTCLATGCSRAALVTVAVGALGVLGARRLMPLIAFSVVGSMGTLLVAVAAFTPAGDDGGALLPRALDLRRGGAVPGGRPRADRARPQRPLAATAGHRRRTGSSPRSSSPRAIAHGRDAAA